MSSWRHGIRVLLVWASGVSMGVVWTHGAGWWDTAAVVISVALIADVLQAIRKMRRGAR